ncbi:hypothetical protein LINPERHAP2_LOCUS41061, partial [Linum perenne]
EFRESLVYPLVWLGFLSWRPKVGLEFISWIPTNTISKTPSHNKNHQPTTYKSNTQKNHQITTNHHSTTKQPHKKARRSNEGAIQDQPIHKPLRHTSIF